MSEDLDDAEDVSESHVWLQVTTRGGTMQPLRVTHDAAQAIIDVWDADRLRSWWQRLRRSPVVVLGGRHDASGAAFRVRDVTGLVYWPVDDCDCDAGEVEPGEEWKLGRREDLPD